MLPPRRHWLWLPLFLVAVLVAGLVTADLTAQAQARRYSLVIATGGIGGVYYYYGTTVAQIITQNTRISATAIQTAASIDNLLLIRDKPDLDRGVIYCAAVLPDSAFLAYTGQDERFAGNPAPFSLLWAMYPNYLHIVTTDATGITDLSDLKGRRVSTGAPGSGTEVEALLVLRAAGIDPEKDFTKWERLGAAESAQALADGTIGAYFWSGGVPTGSIVELGTTLNRKGQQIRLISVTDEVESRFAEAFPGLARPETVPASAYGTPEDARALAFWNMFGCHKDTPPEVAYEVTKAVFEHLPDLVRAVKPAQQTTPENAVRYLGGTIPYNEGALRYFRELGVIQ